MRPFRLLALAPLALGAVLGCERIIGADFSSPRLCTPVLLPLPPPITSGGSGAEFVVVTSSLALGENDLPDGAPGYATIGYSLDGLCTRNQACAPAAWTGAHPVKGFDGRDNGLGEMMHAQNDFFHQVVFRSETLSDNIQKGINAPMLIFRVAGYTGFLNDDEVEVTLYLASPQGADGTNFGPRFDGNDEWPLAPSVSANSGSDGGLASAAAATFVDKHAYVTNYTLTAHFPKGATIRFANVPFATSELTITGKYDPVKKKITNGIVAGRMAISEMFRHVPEVTQLLLQQTLCTDNPNYGPIKKYFCSSRDLSLRSTIIDA